MERRSLTPAQRRILDQFVTETQFPGSSEYAPQKTKAKPAEPEHAPASASSPGLDSQASPPPTSDAGASAEPAASIVEPNEKPAQPEELAPKADK